MTHHHNRKVVLLANIYYDIMAREIPRSQLTNATTPRVIASIVNATRSLADRIAKEAATIDRHHHINWHRKDTHIAVPCLTFSQDLHPGLRGTQCLQDLPTRCRRSFTRSAPEPVPAGTLPTQWSQTTQLHPHISLEKKLILSSAPFFFLRPEICYRFLIVTSHQPTHDQHWSLFGCM